MTAIEFDTQKHLDISKIKSLIKRDRVVKYYPETRDIYDRRRKVARAVFAYFGYSGVEYRKSYQMAIHTPLERFFEIAPETIELRF